MKKAALLLSLVLVMALAAMPAYAAIDLGLKLNGQIDAGLMYGQNPDETVDGYRLTGNVSRLLIEMKLAPSNTTNGDNPKVKFSFGFSSKTDEKNQDKAPNFGNGAFANAGAPFDEVTISNAVATFNGAYWKGGPEVTTEVGKLSAYWDEYVAGDNDKGPAGSTKANGDGIIISGLSVGPFAAKLGHLYFNATNDRATFSNLAGEFGGFDTSFTLVNHYNLTGPTNNTMVNDYHVGISGDVANGVGVEANYASDGLHNGSVYDVEGTLSTIPGIELTAGYRGVDANRAYQPRFAHYDDDLADCKNNTVEMCASDTLNGINLGVSTTQAGVDLGLTYTTSEDPTDADDGKTVTKVTAGTKVSDVDLSGAVTLTTLADSVADKTKYELKAKKSIGAINGSYSFSTETTGGVATPHTIHTFAADTKINTPIADDVKLSGQVKLDSDFTGSGSATQPQIETAAEWTAPNGLNLGLHYANFNQKDKGPVTGDGPESAPGDKAAEGFYITADYSVKF